MNIDNAKRRLLDSEQELSYSQRIAISNLIERLESQLLEMAEVVIYYNNGNCSYSVVEKAEQVIKELTNE